MQFPDIEIYAKRPEPEKVNAWLDHRFGVRSETKNADARIYALQRPEIECVVVENAVKGGFTSLWFRSGSMPWATDRDCALEAFDYFGVEVRCSSGPWQEGDDDAQWIRFTGNGESRVNWF